MWFAPQRRALFQPFNFQKCSDTEVRSAFRLRPVLRATAACAFSTSHLPKCSGHGVFFDVFYILTSKCASLRKGVHFFNISTSKSVPTLRCFCSFCLGNVLRATTACNFSSLIPPNGSAPALASVLFDPPEPQIIGKTHCFAIFLDLFVHLHLLSSDLSLLWSSLFFLSLL